MPDIIMPLFTGIFLLLAGVSLGYFLWHRDGSPVDTVLERMEQENRELLDASKHHEHERLLLANDVANQKSRVFILQELCDDLAAGREYQSDVEARITELNSELASQRTLLGESREECALAMSEKGLFEASLMELRKQFEERDQSITCEKGLNGKISALQTRLENQEQTIHQLRETSKQFANDVRSEVGARLEVEASAKDVRHQMQTQTHKLRLQIEEHENAHEELTARISQMDTTSRGNLDLLEKRTTEATQFGRACEQLATRIAEMEKSQMAEAKLRELHNTERAQLTGERDALILQLKATQEERSVGSAKLETARSEYSAIAIERDEMQQRLCSLKEYYSRGSSLLEQRIVEIGTLRQERDELSARLSHLEIQNTTAGERLRVQNTEVKTRIHALIKQRDRAFSDLKKLRAETEKLQTEMAQLKQEQSRAVILPFGEQFDSEYGGRTRHHETRGLIYVQAPESSDDLKLISGIAQVLEDRLNEYGVYTFKQIMHWEEKTVREFSTLLAFKDRIDRDDWIGQAARFYYEKNRSAA